MKKLRIEEMLDVVQTLKQTISFTGVAKKNDSPV